MKTYSNKQKAFFLALPFLLVVFMYLIGNFAYNIKEYLPPCFSYEAFHIYCPGCGSTRAVFALLHGDILLSLRQNVLVSMYIIAGILIYIEFLFKVFSKNPPFSMLKMKYFWGLLAFACIYAFARNFIPAIAPI